MIQPPLPQRDRVYSSVCLMGMLVGVALCIALWDPESALHQRITAPSGFAQAASAGGEAFSFDCAGPQSHRIWAYLAIPVLFVAPLILVHHAWPGRSAYTLAAIVCSLPWIVLMLERFTFEVSIPLALVWAIRYFLPNVADRHMQWRLGGVRGIAPGSPAVPSESLAGKPAEG